jgi:O-antigen/teichoic acid export membrane protein
LLGKIKSKIKGDIHLKEILTGSAVTFALKISGMFLGYLVILIISQQYGAEGIGVYNLTLSMITFIAMIAAMGMNFSILRYVGQFNKIGEEFKLRLLYRYAVEIVTPFSLLLAVILYFFAGAIADNLFHNPVYKPALELAAFIVPFMTLQNVSVEFIRGLKNLKVSEFLRSVNRPIINIILLLIVGQFVVDQFLPLYTLGAGVIVSAIFAVYFIATKLKKIESNTSNDFSKKKLISASLPMMATTIAAFLMGNVSLFMLEAFSTTEEVGVFSVAFKIATLISLILFVVNTISGPKFSELYWAGKHKELQDTLDHSSKLIFISSLSIAIIFYILSKTLLSIFGEEFIVGDTALILLITGQLMYSVSGSAGVFLNMIGRQLALRNIIVVVVSITILLDYFLIPIYGMNGAAFTFIIGAIILNLSMVIYIKKLNYRAFYIPFQRSNR